MSGFVAHGRTDPGRVREQNEDAFRVSQLPDGSTLLVVCDGMGGHGGGQLASAAAVERICRSVAEAPAGQDARRVLYDALVQAHAAVLSAAASMGDSQMGTTAVVAWVRGAQCFVGYVGDSRLYQLRNGAVVERTRDHTRVELLVQAGQLTPEQAREHPDAHVLARTIGAAVAAGTLNPEVWREPLALQPGDGLLLCSDGLHDYLQDAELFGLGEKLDVKAAVDRFVSEANQRGGADNITVALGIFGDTALRRHAPPARTILDLPSVPASPGVPAAAPAPAATGRTPAWLVPAVVAGVVALVLGALGGWLVRGKASAQAAPPIPTVSVDAGTPDAGAPAAAADAPDAGEPADGGTAAAVPAPAVDAGTAAPAAKSAPKAPAKTSKSEGKQGKAKK
jgi:serine/threonine protein phosphatase PrpC